MGDEKIIRDEKPDPFAIRDRPCLRSGLCCKTGPCAYGTWDADRRQCAHLLVEEVLPNGAEVHACGIYDQIIDEPGAQWNPAFGASCCMPLFNQGRENIIAGLKGD